MLLLEPGGDEGVMELNLQVPGITPTAHIYKA
jgi:hypothetical protein